MVSARWQSVARAESGSDDESFSEEDLREGMMANLKKAASKPKGKKEKKSKSGVKAAKVLMVGVFISGLCAPASPLCSDCLRLRMYRPTSMCFVWT